MKTTITITVPDFELADSDTEELTDSLRDRVADWLWLKEAAPDRPVGEDFEVNVSARVSDC